MKLLEYVLIVDDKFKFKVKDIHRLTKRIEYETYMNLGIILTIGIYASIDNDFSD